MGDGDRDAAVVCIFGNTATWTDIHDEWPESCTPYADICITVRDKTLDQTKHEESDFDPSSCIEAVGVASKRKCMVGLQANLALTLPILSLFT